MPDKFGYAKQGYNPTEVDSYIDSLETVIKSYKEKDSAIKNAIISAQIAAENIIKNAELEAQELKSKTLLELKTVSDSISKQREHIKNFQNEYNLMLGKYLKNFDEDDLIKVYSSVNEMENYLFSLKKQLTETSSDNSNSPSIKLYLSPVSALKKIA